MLRTYHYIKEWKYLDGVLSIMFDEKYLKNITNQWFHHILNFNKEHIIQCYNIT